MAAPLAEGLRYDIDMHRGQGQGAQDAECGALRQWCGDRYAFLLLGVVLLAEECNSWLLVYLNRPDARNGFTQQMAYELEYIFRLVDEDNKVKVVVLAGKGAMFCAGADLKGGFDGEPGELLLCSFLARDELVRVHRASRLGRRRVPRHL